MLIISNMGDQVWLMTSRQTDPDLAANSILVLPALHTTLTVCLLFGVDLQFVDVGVENAINKANARGFVRVLVGEFDVDLPHATLKWRCLAISIPSCILTIE